MELVVDHNKDFLRTAVSTFAVGGVIFAAFTFGGSPLFSNTDNFVIFAEEEASIKQEVQISSGDLGANKKLDIAKDVIVNGNLFADRVDVDKGSVVNGNVSANKFKLKKDAQVLGATSDVSLPIADFPGLPNFEPESERLKFNGQDNFLNSGSFGNVSVEKDSELILVGGTYNLSKLILKKNSVLIYSSPTVLNIQEELRGQGNVAILPGQNILPDDLTVNYIGKKLKKDKENKNDKEDEEKKDNEEDINEEEEKEDVADEKANGGKTVKFGKNSFLNFKIFAPNATVRIGDTSTFRGQILARKVKVGRGSVLSREEEFELESDLSKIVEDDGLKFVVDEIVVLLREDATFVDAQQVATAIGGRITGSIASPKLFKIEVQTVTAQQLNAKIQETINLNNPLVLEVVQNLLAD